MNSIKLSENAAAISAEFHKQEAYQDLYMSCGEAVGGFPGFWQLCASLARVVTEWEEIGGLNFDEGNPEWVAFVDEVVGLLVHHLRNQGRAPMELEWQTMVGEAAVRAIGKQEER